MNNRGRLIINTDDGIKVIEGDWTNGKFEGKGKIVSTAGISEGTFKEGKIFQGHELDAEQN